ncbi:hypothetical protein D1007_00998 [Hordeum vulgare]|nr:hypothetical protein D1007_00998 [Hordeum vulgare]
MEALHREVAEGQDAHATRVSEANAKLSAWEEEIQVADDAKASVDHVVLSCVELRARHALSSICRLELESPLVPHDKLSSELVKELYGATKKVDGILEEEYRDLFSVAVTRVLIHLLVRDPRFKFEEVMGPVLEESRGDMAVTMKGHMNMLLGKIFYDDGEEPQSSS